MTTTAAPFTPGHTVHLHDLFDEADLNTALDAGMVRKQVHPTEPLAILNYTEKCAYEEAWTPVTLACRGLIYRTDTFEVAARGFNKFFNYGQRGAPALDLHGPAEVTDKADGSLGILYPLPSGGHAIATRGSFASDQALHATKLWQDRYAHVPHTDGWTMLFEIVYPANRIVLDYGNTDDLILLGAVENATGAVISPNEFTGMWPGPVTRVFEACTLADALAQPPRPNAEGLIVRCLTTGGMVKIKQADYVALHRIVTGLNARVIWQHLVDGKHLADLIAPLPDEFHQWCRDVAGDLRAAVDRQHAAITAAYNDLIADLPAGSGRREFAARAVQHPHKWALFMLLDGRDIRPQLLYNAKPEPYLTPAGRIFGEDTA